MTWKTIITFVVASLLTYFAVLSTLNFNNIHEMLGILHRNVPAQMSGSTITLNIRCDDGSIVGSITVVQRPDESYEAFMARAEAELIAAKLRFCR